MFQLQPRHDFLEPGTMIENRYRINSLVARGPNAAIYAATHLMMSRNVTLHMLCSGGDTEIRRFRRSCRLVSRFRHPNVVTVHDMGKHDELPYLALEYLQGHNLAERSMLRGPMAIDEFADLAEQVLLALSYIHAHKVIHRDVSAENLIVSESPIGELVKLTQFSFSKELGATTHTTQQEQQKMIAGLTHVSPEQILSPDEVDHRTDIYGASVVFYRLLGGAAPFQAKSLAALATEILEKSPDSLLEFCDHVSPELDEVITRGMSKKPDRRYQQAEDMLAALRAAVRALPPTLRPAP